MSDALVPYISSAEISTTLEKILVDCEINKSDLKKLVTNNDSLALTDDSDTSCDDKVLGEIFQADDEKTSSPKQNSVSKSKFCHSILTLKGLVTFISANTSEKEKSVFLDAEALNNGDDDENIVFIILSFINSYLFSVIEEDKEIETKDIWSNEAVNAILDLLNESFPHPFMISAMEICREFVINILSNLNVGYEKNILKIQWILSSFSASKFFGKMIISFMLEKFLEIGDILREHERYKIEDETVLLTFQVYNNLLLNIWPPFAEAICEVGMVSAGANRRRERDRTTGPRLGLAETTQLSDEMMSWLQMLSSSTVGLSIVQPEFYHAVNNVSQFIHGLLQRLNRQK